MSDFYIFSTKYLRADAHEQKETRSVTIIFCNGDYINEKNIQNEVKLFYEKEYQTDDIVVIGGEFIIEALSTVFLKDCLETFKFIPKLQPDHLLENIFVYAYNKIGSLSCLNGNGLNKTALKNILNDGLVNIFINRGGLIEAKGDAHHFIFPSGKHSNKFLRTGNILINSPEIYFIAFNLLKIFDENVHEKIYCDTSSINTLAFALLDLKRRLVKDKAVKLIPIESFSSYEGLFAKKVRFFDNSLILVSSSTSGNIIERITDHDDSVDTNNIAILYFLGSKKDFKANENNIVCNLTKSETNFKGIKNYDTFSAKECIHCKNGSYPVEVKGDVFLLEKPKINRITLKTTDAPKKLSNFVQQYKSHNISEKNVLKVNYKENRETERKYEVYFDMAKVLSSIDQGAGDYKDFKTKLFDYINQYIPSNTKYLIALPDTGSEILCKIVLDQITPNYVAEKIPQIVKFNEVSAKIIEENIEGAAVIIGSIISNGKNLLYLSRALRPFNKLKLVYFIGLVQTNSDKDLEFLKQNLKQGNYGKETNSFVEVESFFCDNDSKNTTWVYERKFLLDNLVELSEQLGLTDAHRKIEARIELINNSWSNTVKGLANQLFYTDIHGNELRLRKGFAFINFDKYINDISQADVYYSMSAILNELRNCDDYDRCLKQSEYVRNIIDPGNFNRFNDGVIQACILRASKQSELLYHLDYGLSNDMKVILEKIIDENSSPQGEGLIEFLYAIAIKKLTFRREHLSQLSIKISKIQGSEIIQLFNQYIIRTILSERPSMQERIEELEQRIKDMEGQRE